jgi:iron complex outermembrane receptor protein
VIAALRSLAIHTHSNALFKPEVQSISYKSQKNFKKNQGDSVNKNIWRQLLLDRNRVFNKREFLTNCAIRGVEMRRHFIFSPVHFCIVMHHISIVLVLLQVYQFSWSRGNLKKYCQNYFVGKTKMGGSKMSMISGKYNKMRLQKLLISASILCFSYDVSPAFSAEFVAETSLEEIIVTARKREESLQSTPIAIAAFSENQISSRGIISVSELGYATPNVIIDAGASGSGSNSATTMFIRGIGQTDFTLSVDPGVGFYVDGVYYGQQVGTNVDFLALERVEILKGPQGTLFGRNTIGGAVNIITKKPSKEFGGIVKATLGSAKQANFSGSVDIPLSDTLFSKFSVSSRNRDGYVTRLTTGEKLGSEDKVSARGTLLWEAASNLTFTLEGDMTRERDNGAPEVLISVNPNAPLPFFHNIVLVGAPCMGAGALTNPSCYNGQWVTGGNSESGTFPAQSTLDLWGLSLTSEYTGDVVNIKSITAYRHFNSFFSLDNDHSPLKIVQFTSAFKSSQFTQEFQFSGKALDNRLNWLVGLYYYKEKSSDRNPVDFSIGSLEVGGDLDVESYAAFAQATYSLTDKLDVTAGLRYTDEKKIRDPHSFLTTSLVLGPTLILPAGTVLVPAGDAEVKATATTAHLNAAYHWTSDIMTYATFSQGFKGGGFTDRVSFPVSSAPTFKPERVESYELGAKTSLFDKRLTANLSAFYIDYTNIQVLVATGIAPTIQNAAAGRVQGVELDVQALLAPGLIFSGGIGHIDAKYTSVNPLATEITLNKKFPKSPKWTYNASLSYEANLDGHGSLTPRVDWYYRSQVFNDALNAALASQKSYHLINAGITYRNPSQSWSLELMGKNLTDQRYLLNAKSNGAQGFVSGAYARPREWSLSLQAAF